MNDVWKCLSLVPLNQFLREKKGWKQIFSDWYETLLYVLSLKMPFILAQLKKNDCFEISFSELSLEGGAGVALAP